MCTQQSALVFDFHRGTTHDGPGMRTTVFLKGCPLHCAWCHNPESIAPYAQLQWSPKNCIGCQLCVQTCPHGALQLTAQGIAINRDQCARCFACVNACPTGAMERIGKVWQVPALCKEACKDEIFFDSFGGGVTISGGEPMLQTDAVFALLTLLKQRRIHTALDTCGVACLAQYERIFPLVDTFLFDLKLYDSAQHKHFTGADNAQILANFNWLSAQVQTHSEKELWVRTPLIPNATDMPENLHALGAYLQDNTAVARWELCAFNNVCRDKYAKLDLAWQYENTPLMTQTHAQNCLAIAQQYVGERAILSGLTAKE